jgi:cytoskeletal protein CcmA (bactofilin family)
MFSHSGDKPAADQVTAPAGMRELPSEPARPAMPAFPAATPSGIPEPAAPATDASAPGPDDSVIARDDHVEGTFTSRGTVVVMGSLKGRIEAVRVRIEDGATVDADVIVDEAIVAGEFTGNLTCRERLEARASGRINGRVETFKLMLHEGASVEGEMHMLTEKPTDASATIRGTAPLRGEAPDAPDRPLVPAAPAAKPAPSMPPTSEAKPTPAVAGASAPAASSTPAEASAVRSSVVETLKAESSRMVAPRTSTTTRGYGYSGPTSPSATGANGARTDKSGTTTGF